VADPSTTRFGDHLSRSMDVLRRDRPVHFAAARRALNGLAAAIHVEGEPTVRACLDQPPWVTYGETAEIDIELSQRDLLALLRGQMTLEAATEDGRLRLRGEIDHLASFLEALNAWLHGALRCPALGRMHGAYLAGTEDQRPATD
jgi:hypothetical protein